eukprot:6485095-Amphidinium_carterae.1
MFLRKVAQKSHIGRAGKQRDRRKTPLCDRRKKVQGQPRTKTNALARLRIVLKLRGLHTQAG